MIYELKFKTALTRAEVELLIHRVAVFVEAPPKDGITSVKITPLPTITKHDLANRVLDWAPGGTELNVIL